MKLLFVIATIFLAHNLLAYSPAITIPVDPALAATIVVSPEVSKCLQDVALEKTDLEFTSINQMAPTDSFDNHSESVIQLKGLNSSGDIISGYWTIIVNRTCGAEIGCSNSCSVVSKK